MFRKSTLTILSIILLSGSVAYLVSCKKNQNPSNLTLVEQEIPASFPQPKYRFADNPLTREGIELGRQLFYDGRLSRDGNYPCASCHQQIAAFGTYEHDRSHGYNGSHTLRNAPVLFNLAWQEKYHWDGQFSTLFAEAAQPINSHIEMAESFDEIIAKLQKDENYVRQFRKIFRTPFISPEQVLKVLSQFTGSMVSANSKYDRVKKGEAAFTTLEDDGYRVFLAHCNSCHREPMFTDYSFRNIGLPVDNLLNDFGRLRITHDPEDSLKFKVPTLRNVYISSNYMHDGRFNTLAQCITHYRTGVQQSATLDSSLVNGISLSDGEAVNLALFLRTLTDSSFLTDPRYSKP